MNNQHEKRLVSFDLPDAESAMRLAQEIANACGATVTVVDTTGEKIGQADAQQCVKHKPPASIAAIQQLAETIDAKVRSQTKGS